MKAEIFLKLENNQTADLKGVSNINTKKQCQGISINAARKG